MTSKERFKACRWNSRRYRSYEEFHQRASQKRFKHASDDKSGKVCRTNDKRFKHASGETPGKVCRAYEGSHAASQKNGNMPLEFQERSKVCRAYEGFHETQRCYYLFQKKALKDRPQAACPKIVKQTLKDDSILKEQVKRWARDGGKEKEKVDSAFFE
jgi:hypothetical protein